MLKKVKNEFWREMPSELKPDKTPHGQFLDQNEQDYQKLLKRHMAKGQMLKNFDLPATQGRELRRKTADTEATLTKFANNPMNREYGRRISLKLSKPDYHTGFGDAYLTGTHFAT